MNSSSPALAPISTSNHGSRIPERVAESREATLTAIKVETIIKVEDEEPVQSDGQLASTYREHLLSMRSNLTCSICDGLLYEPWTLQCGHTYCYSCLCQWFIPNRRKKTCPECRAAVKQIPAPSFLVKNMVEKFIGMGQLMPHDETVEQHKLKNAEETQTVETDKKSPEGLFRGSFPLRHGELWRDEADGVMRCPSCGHEHEGGPACVACGIEFDDVYGFSDMSDDGDLSDIELGYDDDDDIDQDLDAEMQLEMEGNGRGMNYYEGGPFIGGPAPHFLHHYHAHHHGYHADDTTDGSDTTSNQDNSEDEDAGSLENFVERDSDDDDDDEPIAPPRRPRLTNQRRVINITDDEEDEEGREEAESEDEGGAVTNRRRTRRTWTRTSSPPSITFIDDEHGSSTNGSEFGDEDSHALRTRLRASGGWSPLDEEDDDSNRHVHDGYGGYTTNEDETATDESDSETIGNPHSDDEDDDDRPREGFSETPRYENADFRQNHDDYPSSMDGDSTPNNYARGEDDTSDMSDGNPYDYDTDGDQSDQTNMDRDGDTEMSMSPGLSRASRSVSVDNLYGENLGENLGVANEMAEVDDGSSDTSIWPPPRRQPRQNPLVQQYDPRISMLFAEHQNSVRNAHNPAGLLDGWENETNRPIRAESRIYRRIQNLYQAPPQGNSDARNNRHRIAPPRGFDRARTPRGSSPLGVVPASSRNNRLQRQYRR